MNIGRAFPSKYLKHSDLQGRRLGVTIERVEVEKIGDKQKPVVYFVGKPKGLVLNVTNARAIAEIAGGDEEMDNWAGVHVLLYPTKVDFQGGRVDAIRVEAEDRPAKPPIEEDDNPF